MASILFNLEKDICEMSRKQRVTTFWNNTVKREYNIDQSWINFVESGLELDIVECIAVNIDKQNSESYVPTLNILFTSGFSYDVQIQYKGCNVDYIYRIDEIWADIIHRYDIKASDKHFVNVLMKRSAIVSMIVREDPDNGMISYYLIVKVENEDSPVKTEIKRKKTLNNGREDNRS